MQTVLATLSWIQIALSVLLVIAILMQARGSGVGESFGGSGAVYRTRRGIEKSLYTATILLAILFAVVSLVRLLV